MTTETNELHTAIYTTQTLLKQAADVIEQNMNSLAEAHTRNGIIDDTEVQASIESDADLIAELRAAALSWDQRHKSTERPPRRAHQFTAEQVAAVRADLLGAMQAHGVDTQNSETVTQTFEGLPMRKLKVLLTAGWTINGVSIERTVEDGTTRRGAVTTGGMVLWWHETEGQAVPETNFGDMAAPVQPVSKEQSRKGFREQDAQWTFKGMTAWQVWQKAIAWQEATPPAQPAPVQEPLTVKLKDDWRTDDFGRPIIYDTDEVDEVTHALTGDEGEEDSLTVLNRMVRYVSNVWPGKTALQVLIECEEAMIATPPAAQPAPDLQAELEATNRQVEILSDALAESRRELAALKAVQEPVAIADGTFNHNCPIGTPLYTTPQAAQRQWVGLTDDEIIGMYNEPRSDAEMIAFGREVEAKLKEKNNG
jgi:hypothetical protein